MRLYRRFTFQKCVPPSAGKKFLFLELSTVLYVLCPTVWIHKGPISLEAKISFLTESSSSISQPGDHTIFAFLTSDPKRRASEGREWPRGMMEQGRE